MTPVPGNPASTCTGYYMVHTHTLKQKDSDTLNILFKKKRKRSEGMHEKTKELSGVSSFKGANPRMAFPPSWTQLKLVPHISIIRASLGT